MKKRAYDSAIVTVLVVIAVAISVGLYSMRSKVIKGRDLIRELANFRSVVALYILTNKTRPATLEQLVSESAPYMSGIYRNKEGVIIDPFGHEYAYEPETGWIRSETAGYEKW